MKRLVLLGVALGVLALLPLLYERGVVRMAYPDPRTYPVRGIDVSHQGAIDWPSVAKDNVRFVFVKATEGGDMRDADFGANAAAARQAGLSVGAYHFFTLCRSGPDQALNYLAAIEGARLHLPPVVDLEYVGNCSARPSKADFTRELTLFLQAVETATGRRPILYVTHEFHADYLANAGIDAYPLWMRDIVFGLDRPPGTEVLFWQFAARGRVAGVDGPVDLNVFTGTERAFGALVGG